MERIKIRTENLFQIFQLLMRDSVFRILLCAEGFALIIAAGVMVYNLNIQSMNEIVNGNIQRIIPDRSGEISSLPSDLFESVKGSSGSKPGMARLDLILTGTGMVKGIFKASIEDSQGNYYYVREGDKVKGMLVKKIGSGEVVLMDKSGNKRLIKLER